MNRHPARPRLLVLAIVVAILAGLLAVTAAADASAVGVPRHAKRAVHHGRSTGLSKRTEVQDGLPVILVHGAGSGPGCFGYDTDHYWAGLTATLAAMNWRGPVRSVRYYCGDLGSAGSVDLRNGAQYNFDTPIEIIAHNLAWWLYRTYSSHDQAVDIVGHSMGGLIIRYAMYRTGGKGWPPYLIVRQALTLSTPHGGIPGMDLNICAQYAQCREMEPHSDFLDNLQQHANPPQGRGGTQWTLMGGGACDTIPASSTLSMHGADTITFDGTAPTCYTHGSYLDDTHVADDVPYSYHYSDGPTLVGLGVTPDRWIVHQLQR